MKITYDKEGDALYLYVRKGKIDKTRKINEDLLVDVDKNGDVLGIEMLFVSSKKEILIPSDILFGRQTTSQSTSPSLSK